MKIKRKWLIIGIIIVVIVVVPTIWGRFLVKKEQNGLENQNITITPQMISKVKKGNLQNIVATSGYLEPEDQKALVFNLSGEIEKVLIKEGQRVTEGEELIVLERSQQELNYLKAKNAYELIKINGSESEIEEQRLNFQIVQKNLEDTILRAPFSGLITEVSVKPGDYISAGTQVGYLIDDSNYKVEVSINEVDSLGIKVDQEAIITLDAFPKRTFSGKVVEIHHYTINVNGVVTLPVVVQFNEVDPYFKPGFSALVEIIVGKAEGKLLVPVTALVNNNGKQMVIKMVDNKPVSILVKTGLSDGVNTVIEEGLSEGDEIITNAYMFGAAALKSANERSRTIMMPGMGGPPR